MCVHKCMLHDTLLEKLHSTPVMFEALKNKCTMTNFVSSFPFDLPVLLYVNVRLSVLSHVPRLSVVEKRGARYPLFEHALSNGRCFVPFVCVDYTTVLLLQGTCAFAKFRVDFAT